MKIAIIGSVVLGSIVLTAPSEVQPQPEATQQVITDITVPAWLDLPVSEFLTGVEYNGEIGAEASRGSVIMDLPGDGEAEMAWLAKHFRGLGFHVDQAGGTFQATDQFFAAVEAATGRSVDVTRTIREKGVSLRIDFTDPLAKRLAVN